jgi:hypothetical protein
VTGGTGVFYDVAIGPGSSFNPLTITACGLGTGGNALEWWNGSIWQPFSNQVAGTGVNAGCVIATVDPATSIGGTSPTTQEMTGTPIAAVNAATGDFSVNISPKSQNLGENGSVAYTITVGSTGGFAEPVALTVTGLPSGVTGSFSPATVNPENGSVTSVLTLMSGPVLTSSGGSFSVTGTYGSGSGAVVHSANDGSVTLNFELQPTCYGTITGTVTDAQTGLPVAGANITSSGNTQATTAADGTYTLSPIPLGANNGTTNTYEQVTKPGYFNLSSSAILVSCGPIATYSPQLTEIETGALQGHVFVGVPNPASPTLPAIPTATPLVGALLSLQEYQANTGLSGGAATVAASDGSYSFSGIPVGTGNAALNEILNVSGPTIDPPGAPLGYWGAAANPRISPGSTTAQDIALVPICGGGTITATVYSQDSGLPLANATVRDGSTSVVTDANGVAVFSNLEQGYNNGPIAYAFTAVNQAATGTSQGLVETTLNACGDSSSVSLYVHVPVSNYGNVTGTVLDSVTNLPIPGALVANTCSSYAGGNLTQPNAQGQFSDTSMLIGTDSQTSLTCTFSASAPGHYNSSPANIVINEDLTTTVALTLAPQESATVTGTVTDALTGQPVAGVAVSGAVSGVTNAQGQYTVSGNSLLGPNNAPQLVNFSFLPQPGILQSGSGSVTVAAGETSVLNVQLEQACGPATVSGAVYNASNQAPIAGAHVSSIGGTKVTDTNGSFLLQIPTQNVSYVTYITASATGFNPKTEGVEIYCGAHIVLNFGQNGSGTGTLTGTVTNAATSAVVPGAAVEASWGAVTTTNAQGSYTFVNVPLGNNNVAETWDVTVVPPSGSPLQPEIQSVTVPGSTTTTLNFALGSTRPPLPTAIDQSYVTPKNTTLTIPAPGVLDGDSGLKISVTSYQGYTNHFANVTVNPDGSFSYVPYNNFEGLDAFTYTITDEYGVQAQATATVQVGPEAFPPTDVNYAETVNAGSALVVNTVNGLASQATGTGLTFSALSQPVSGKLVLSSDGSYTYTPNTGFHGHDYFFYQLVDGVGETVNGTVGITVVPPPAPTAANISVSTPFNTALTVTAPGIFTGATGTGLLYGGSTPPSHGTVIIHGDGSYTYTPSTGFSGTDSFGYRIVDSYLQAATATVTITVAGLAPPSAANYAETLPNGFPYTVTAANGLLSNDSGKSLTVTSNTNPTHGSVTVDASGSYVYTPNSGYFGSDSFTYTVTDAYLQKATGTVNLTVTPPVPTAPNYTESTPFKTPLVVPNSMGVLSQASGAGITGQLKSGPHDGTITLNANGAYTYRPYATFSGTDSFTYSVTDAFDQTATGVVTVLVAPKSSAAPTAVDYSATTEGDTALIQNAASGVLSNDTGDTITVTSSTSPAHGTVTVNADGSYTYTPTTGYVGSDSFQYTITDAESRTATGTVNISVTLPPKPTAPSYTESTQYGTPLVISSLDGVLSQATGMSISITANTSPAHGSLTLSAVDGSYIYTPNASYSGADSFTYSVTDPFNQTATGTVNITVQPPAPLNAANYTESTPPGTTLTVDAAHGAGSNDTGSGLTYSLATQATHGTAVVNSDGSYTYAPNTGFTGVDSFTYNVTDAQSQNAMGTITIDVGAQALPVVTKVLPPTGPDAGGTSVELIGTGFTGATEVEFGTTTYFLAGSGLPMAMSTDATPSPSLTFDLVSPTEITLVDPSGSGVVDARVITPVGTSALTTADQFTYQAAVTTTPTTAVPQATPTAAAQTTGALAATGANFGPLLATAGAFIGLGGILFAGSRGRRKRKQARS